MITHAYLDNKNICNTDSKKHVRSNDVLQKDWTFCALLQETNDIIQKCSS